MSNTRQASESQAETYRKEIRRLAALLLCGPSASASAVLVNASSSSSGSNNSSSRAVEGDVPAVSPGSGRYSTPPGRGKRPSGGSLSAAEDAPSRPLQHHLSHHNSVGSTEPSSRNGATRGGTPRARMGWSTTPGDRGLFWRQQPLDIDLTTPGQNLETSPPTQEQKEVCEEDEETVALNSCSGTDGDLTGPRAAHLGEGDGTPERSRTSLSVSRQPARCGRGQTKRAPGWGPSAGRYSKIGGVSRLRLALQGGKSSTIFAQGASTRRLALARESPGGGWHDGRKLETVPEGSGATDMAPDATKEEMSDFLGDKECGEESPPDGAAGGPRAESPSVDDRGNAEGDDGESGGERWAGSVETQGKNDGDHPFGRLGSPMLEEESKERGGFAGDLTGADRSEATRLSPLPPARGPGAYGANGVPPDKPEKDGGRGGNGEKDDGKASPLVVGSSSTSPSSSVTRSVSEGVASRYQRRTEFALPPPPASSAANGGVSRDGGTEHRRSSSSPLPPRSPRLYRPSPKSEGSDDDDPAGVPIKSPSSVSDVGSSDESGFESSSASGRPLPGENGTSGRSRTFVKVKEKGAGGRVSSSRGAVHSRTRAALERRAASSGGGGRHEICAILGGGNDGTGSSDGGVVVAHNQGLTGKAARHDESRHLSSSNISSNRHTHDSDAMVQEVCRLSRKQELQEGRGGLQVGEGMRCGGTSTSDGGLGLSLVLGPASDTSISDLSDGGFDSSSSLDWNTKDHAFSTVEPPFCQAGVATYGAIGVGVPPGATELLGTPTGSLDCTTADGIAPSPASAEGNDVGGVLEEVSLLAPEQPQLQKPRIIELYRSSVASSTSVSSGGRRCSSSSSSSSSSCISSCSSCTPSGHANEDLNNKGDDEESLEVSLGSSDYTADPFTGKVSLGSLNLRQAVCRDIRSDSGSSDTEHSFSVENVGRLPAAVTGAASTSSEQAAAKTKPTDSVDENGTGDGRTDGEVAQEGMREGKDGEEGQEGEQPRLFESLISVGIPAHWDLRPLSNQPTSAEATGRDVTPSANRRSWGIYDNESDNPNRSSGGGSGAGSWIRSVFSSSPSGGRRVGEKPPADVSPRPRSIDPGPRRGNLSAKSSSSVAEETTVSAPAGTIPDGDNDANRLRDVTGTAKEEGTTPVPHGSVEGRLAPQQVLARYPPDATLPFNVSDYCFPQGVRATRIDARASQSSLNKVLYQPGACQRGSQSFVFMFSGDHGFRVAGEARNHRTYGVCVTYPKVMPSREVSRNESESGRSPQGDDAGEEDKDRTALTAAPLAETPGTGVTAGTVKEGGDEKGRGARGQSPPRTRGGRRGRRGGGYKGGGTNGADVQVWGCYCLLSRLPLFDLHFQILWDLLAAERIMRMKLTAERRGGLTASDEITEAALLSSRVEELLLAVSRRYMRQAVPAPGETVRFQVHPDLPEIHYQRGAMPEFHGGHHVKNSGPNNNSVGFASYDSFASLRGDRIPPHVKDGREMIDGVAAWALPGTLSLIPVDILVAVVGALMCEYQVIVVSENLGLLSSAVLALAALTRPLLWVHPLVPVMPVDMSEVLSAPVPYLIGTPRLVAGAEGGGRVHGPLSPGQVLLDADEKKVVFAHAEDASRTELPRYREDTSRALLARLAPLAKVLGESCVGMKRETPLHLASGSQAAASEVVQATVAAHISAVCTTALRHREEIIATTITPKSTPDVGGLTPTSSFTEFMSSIDTTAEGDGVGHAGGEALERGGVVGGPHAGSCGGGDSSADGCDHNGVGGGDIEPPGHEHQMQKCIAEQKRSPDTKGGEANQLEEREINMPQSAEDGAGEEPPAVNAAAVGSTEASSSPNSLVETDAADHAASAGDDGDDDDDWWEEDEEDSEGKDGGEKDIGHIDTAASATHGAWWGTAGKGVKSQGGGEGREVRGVGSGTSSTSRWMRRREREAPFLRLLVRSQAFEVFRAAAAEKQ
ncbi:unnamed protein product [Ectocarpus sp. 12 AP-2014]